MTTNFLSRLSDEQLVAEVKRLATGERNATAALLRSLIELDARRLYLAQGCSTLFTFCTEVLQLSADAAYTRIEVARAAHSYPPLLDALDCGELTLTAARLLAPHLTSVNQHAVIDAARGKGKREILELIAVIRPMPDACPSINLLPPNQSNNTAPFEITPLAPERYRVRFTIGRETLKKLEDIQDLLRHSIRDGDLEEIFDRAITLLLHDSQRRRFAATHAPRRPREVHEGSRKVPASVQRTVFARDGGRCTFVGPNGRCTETTLLQFDHILPFAAGGKPTVENIRLRCAAHNRYEADLFFGRGNYGLLREQITEWP